MAVHIRLQRFGAKKNPFYRIVVADSRNKRDGAFLEQLGTYDPMKAPGEIKLDLTRVDHWVKTGALPTDTTASLIRRFRREQPPAPAQA